MGANSVVFPQFPGSPVLISYFSGLDEVKLKEVKQQLVAGNKNYDFCFLNTRHIISLEHLYSSVHKSLLNWSQNSMRAKTLNTEIIFNLSPINNIMDALKRFGVDELCPAVIVVKVLEENEEAKVIEDHLSGILGCSSIELTDEILEKSVDLKKFKKVYKLNDAKIVDESQGQLTRLAIGACQLRGC